VYFDVGNVSNVICEASIGITYVYTDVGNLRTVIREVGTGTEGMCI
jgi:hypothetical protein